MARTISTDELTRILTAPRLQTLASVEVENAVGAFVSVSNAGGVGLNFVKAIEWGAAIDDPVQNGTLTMAIAQRLGSTTYSLAPFLGTSPLNTDGTGYAPLVYGGRRLRIRTASVVPGTTPGVGDWHTVIDGKIDRPREQPANELTVTFRDQGGFLLHANIQNEFVYGSEAGTPMETVAQQILSTWPGRLGSPTLDVPVSPAWMLRAFKQAKGANTLLAVRELALQIGWDIRYGWTGDTPVLRLTDPDRTRTTPDFWVDPSAVIGRRPVFETGDEDIYNIIRVYYRDVTTGAVQFVTYENTVSRIAHGPRYGEIDQTSGNIDTAPEALRLATAVALDLGEVFADQEATTRYLWHIEPFDLLGFRANNLTYAEDQQFGVVSFRHSITARGARTTVSTRGHVAGAYRTWLDRIGAGNYGLLPPTPRLWPLVGEASSFGGFSPNGGIWLRAEFDSATNRIPLYAKTGPAAGLPTPTRGENANQAGEIRRPEGDVGAEPNFATWVRMATHATYYKSVLAFGVGKLGSEGLDFKAERQAIGGGDFVPGSILDFNVARAGGTNTVTWTSQAPGAVPSGWTVYDLIWRGNMVVHVREHVTGANTFVDSGLLTESALNYDACQFATNNLDLCASGALVSNIFAAPVGGTVEHPAPIFVNGTPLQVDAESGISPTPTGAVRIDWFCDDASAALLSLFRYTSEGSAGYRWVKIADVPTGGEPGSTPQLGTFYDTIINIASYQMQTYDGIGTVLAASVVVPFHSTVFRPPITYGPGPTPLHL